MTPGHDLEIPEAARRSDGGGDPRPPGYWLAWNGCAPENRAAEARQNGWVIADDILADPGVGLGDHVVQTCEEAVAILNGRTARSEQTSDPAFDLAAQLLAAELNLNVGAESCPAAEEATVAGHLILSSAQFDGESTSPLADEASGSLATVIDLLSQYNSGELCR